MLGWSVLVVARSPEERDKSEDDSAYLLAKWQAQTSGLDFLNVLVRQGKARKLLSGGYPERYVAKAVDFLPLISKRPPGTMGPHTEVILHEDRIAACAPEQLLTIDAWDLS
ncbi:hypothetical protein C5614_20420 [Massilia phosphatilytica]|nr:hypothetical protein C5614_20420 [Massilia phosphatilytica]